MTQEEINALGIEHLITRDLHIDPKYSPVQLRLYHKEKGYLIPVDEPLYVLRGNDPMAVQMAEFYVKALADETQSKIVVDHQVTAAERVLTFKEYHKNNPELIGKLYPEAGCDCIVASPSYDIGSDKDPYQDSEYAFWDFKLFHRYLSFFVPTTEPVMIFRGKDALLVSIIDKHTEFIKSNRELYSNPDMMIDYNNKRREQVLAFHTEKPERVGVTCSIFQKPTGKAYVEAMEEYAKQREENLKGK